MMAEDISELSQTRLKKRIKHTQHLLTELENELEKRMLEKQYDSVDHIDEHLDKTDASLLNLTSIIREFLSGKK